MRYVGDALTIRHRQVVLNLPRNTCSDSSSSDYLSYLDITGPAPLGAFKARIFFSVFVTEGTTLTIDQVIFARTATNNLVKNPSFIEGLDNWIHDNVSLFAGNNIYEGNVDALAADTGVHCFRIYPGKCCWQVFCLIAGWVYIKRGASETPDADPGLWLDKNGMQIGLGMSLTCLLLAAGRLSFIPVSPNLRLSAPQQPGCCSPNKQSEYCGCDRQGSIRVFGIDGRSAIPGSLK